VFFFLRCGHKHKVWVGKWGVGYPYVWFSFAQCVEYNLFFYKKRLFEIYQGGR